MTRSGGDYDEMRKNHTTDAGLEAMVTGSADPDHPLGRMLMDLRESATGWPNPDRASEHVAAAVREARLNVQAPTSPTVTPTRRQSTRRRTVFSFLTSSLIGKILAGTVAFAATGGTLAATGTLPDPVQSVVADTVEVVGIHIPDPSDADDVIVVDEEPAVEEADHTEDAAEIADEEAVELEDADDEAELEDADDEAELEDEATIEDASDDGEIEEADHEAVVDDTSADDQADDEDEATDTEDASD